MTLNTAEPSRQAPCEKPLSSPIKNTPQRETIAAVVFKAYAFCLLMLAAFKPGFTAEAVKPDAVLCASVMGFIAGAVFAVATTRGRSERPIARGILESSTLVTAAIALIVYIVSAHVQNILQVRGIALCIAIGCTFASSPLAVIAFAEQASKHDPSFAPRMGILVFLGVDAMLIVAHFFQDIGLALGVVALACAAVITIRQNHNTDHDGRYGATANIHSPSLEENRGFLQTIRPIVSLPFLGFLLAFFTLATTLDKGPEQSGRLIAPLVVAALLAILSLCLTKLPKRRESADNNVETSLNLVLLCVAIIAFVIKMVPLDITTTTLFPTCMEAFFLLLAIPFSSLVISLAPNAIKINSETCAAMSLSIAAAISAAYGSTQLGPNTSSIFMGAITAIFLIYAVVTTGRACSIHVKNGKGSKDVGQAASELDAIEHLAQEGKLTPREREVLVELAAGHSSSYIAELLFISSNTARSHMKNIYKKLGVHSREELLTRIKSEKNDVASLPR